MDKDDFVETGKREIQKQFLWPFWRPFIIAWIICNWKAIYATAFLSEEAIKALSNEKNKLSFVIDLYEKTFLWGNFFGYSLGDHFVLNVFFFCLFIPALAAFVNTFFISHRVGTWFYSKECETDERKRRAKEKAKEIAKKELEEVKLAKLKISDEIKTKEEENEKKWNEEFMKLEEMQDIWEQLFWLYILIFKDGWSFNSNVPTNIKAWATVQGLMEDYPSDHGHKFRLTDKGNLFLQKFMELHPDPEKDYILRELWW